MRDREPYQKLAIEALIDRIYLALKVNGVSDSNTTIHKLFESRAYKVVIDRGVLRAGVTNPLLNSSI
ncbi:hypothetical protein D9M71_514040 [compost metagenome]